ncbi:NTE family protein [Halopseudomonas yangmingensis]|uniref:NTE family protein n=1 Tax=Halopseudomonas yangmingensis TaxID=1720063 RepID=A0A1I4QCK3_9GAMM|nr:NTE family protein [Halopseudomonas yangmingensis]
MPVVSAHCDLIIAVNLNSLHTNGYRLPVIERPAPIRQQWEQWLESFRLRNWLAGRESDVEIRPEALEHFPDALPAAPLDKAKTKGVVRESREDDANAGPGSLLELVNMSFEAMQASLTQYKIAGYPPDLVIDIPKRLCRFFEFYRAPELIELGRQVASDRLDRFERDGH